MNIESLRWKKYPVLNDGFICLVDVMGNDSSIVQAARVSYGKDEREGKQELLRLAAQEYYKKEVQDVIEDPLRKKTFISFRSDLVQDIVLSWEWDPVAEKALKELTEIYHVKQRGQADKDRNLIRYLLNHSHTTPFEMVEFKFLVRVPMDCWRQWIRHRTANVNEYSTRYTEAIDSCQTTSPQEWRLQATDNKQGSSGFLDENNGLLFTLAEQDLHKFSRETYEARLKAGIAKEQARKDLPLSTYTEAYWKCDLWNIFNFLRLRMDSHAQYEIRMYANAMAEIVKQVVPVAWEAFEDYVLYAKKFSRMEMGVLKKYINFVEENKFDMTHAPSFNKPDNLTDREWKQFLEKLQ